MNVEFLHFYSILSKEKCVELNSELKTLRNKRRLYFSGSRCIFALPGGERGKKTTPPSRPAKVPIIATRQASFATANHKEKIRERNAKHSFLAEVREGLKDKQSRTMVYIRNYENEIKKAVIRTQNDSRFFDFLK